MSGLGAAMAGGNPANGRVDDDFYPTPPEVTRTLVSNYQFNGPIHECACGDGAMARELEAGGYMVIATDLMDRGYGTQMDFLKMRSPLAPIIVTNPPFNLAAQFIEHALGTLKVSTLALVLKSTFWHAKSRKVLFDRYPPRLVAPLLWRPDFTGLGRPTMECSWVIWERNYHSATIYEPWRKVG